MAAIASLVVTDFLGVIRLPQRIGTVLMWCVLIVFLLYFLRIWDSRNPLGRSAEWQLQSVINVLIFLQLVLLFQEKDARVYGWLAVMSLLPVVVAALQPRRRVWESSDRVLDSGHFRHLLVGTLRSSQAGSSRSATQACCRSSEIGPLSHRPSPGRRGAYSPLAVDGRRVRLRRHASGSGRTGLVPEYFGRLSLIVVGGFVLATVIFFAVPRPRMPYMQSGDTRKTICRRQLQRQDRIGRTWRDAGKPPGSHARAIPE